MGIKRVKIEPNGSYAGDALDRVIFYLATCLLYLGLRPRRVDAYALGPQKSQRNRLGDRLAARANDKFFHGVAQMVFDGEHG